MPRKSKKEVTAVRSFGAVTKAEVFEELIKKVLGVNVKLEAKEIDKREDSQKGGYNENL